MPKRISTRLLKAVEQLWDEGHGGGNCGRKPGSKAWQHHSAWQQQKGDHSRLQRPAGRTKSSFRTRAYQRMRMQAGCGSAGKSDRVLYTLHKMETTGGTPGSPDMGSKAEPPCPHPVVIRSHCLRPGKGSHPNQCGYQNHAERTVQTIWQLSKEYQQGWGRLQPLNRFLGM